MEHRILTCALVTSNRSVAELIQDRNIQTACGIELVVHHDGGLATLTQGNVEQILDHAPDVLFLDMDDAKRALNLTRFCMQRNPWLQVICFLADTHTAEQQKLLVAAMRSGVRDVLSLPLSPKDLEQACERLIRTQVAPVSVGASTGRKAGTILGFTSPRAGMGATTIASSFALELAKRDPDNVVLVDYDLPLGNVALHCGIAGDDFHLGRLVSVLNRIDDNLLQGMLHNRFGMRVLTLPSVLDDCRQITVDQLVPVLHVLKRRFSWVVVDCGALDSPGAGAVIERLDFTYVVSGGGVDSIQHLSRLLPEWEGRLGGAKDDHARLVLSGMPEGEYLAAQDVLDALKLPIAGYVRQDREAAAKGLLEGVPAGAVKGRVGRDVQTLADAHMTAKKESGGFLARFGKRKGDES